MTLQRATTTILTLLSFWTLPRHTQASLEIEIGGRDISWRGAIVPFEINTFFNDSQKAWIYDAMDEIMEKTCIEFRPKTSDDSGHLSIKNGVHCKADIGQNEGGGEQFVYLNNNTCFKGSGIVVHELMHALGFFHEHARPDRDAFIRVNYANLSNHTKGQFAINGTMNSTPYDFRSVMHYGPCPITPSFVRPDKCQQEVMEFVPLDPKVDITKIGHEKGLSVLDAVKINRAYCPWYKPVTEAFMKKYTHSGPVGKEWKWEEQLY